MFAKIVVALAPAPILLAVFEFLDIFRLMSRREFALLIGCGVLASVIAYPVGGRLIDTLPIGFSGYSRFVAPWIEEILKSVAIVGLYWFNRIGLKLDAAISGFAVGVGFGVSENSFFLYEFPDMNLGVWLVRGLGTAVMHGGTTALFAVVSHELLERQTRADADHWQFRPQYFLPGLLVAVAIHTLFNQFPGRPLIAMVASFLLIPMTLFLVFRWGESEGQKWLASDMEAHHAQLEVLRRDGFRSPETGPLRVALERHLKGRVAEDLLFEYVELHTVLVLRAEEVLQRRSAGEKVAITDSDRNALARFNALKKQLGKAVLMALTPDLPFSRNDLWELRELEEDARRG